VKSPLAIALTAAAAVLAVAFALPMFHMLRGASPAPVDGLPWQVQRHGEAIEVFGLRLPGSVLADAQARWGDGLQLAVVAERGQAGALEAYVDSFDGGGVGGRLVLATGLGAAAVGRLRDNAVRSDALGAAALRYTLRSEDRAEALRSAIIGLSFIPSAKLEAAALEQRFGAPAERLKLGSTQVHWLYPALGLAIVVNGQEKDLLQYVAPMEFEQRLRAPLLAAGAAP
jgi:hypothetical protein